jgi:type II secretory pathway pseudopilin PulG
MKVQSLKLKVKQSLSLLGKGQISNNLKFEIPRDGGVGFTLIEILVAIGIMIIAFGFIISSAASIQRRARDDQRITDLQNIQAALAQYSADQQFYPDLIHNSLVLSSATQLTDKTGNTIASATKTYLLTVPKDPGTTYCYKPQKALSDASACDNSSVPTACHYYLLCAQLE